MTALSENYLSRQIKPNELTVYLRSKGWIEETSEQKYLTKFRSPTPIDSSQRYINIFIPKNEKLVDYRRTIQYTLNAISAFENRDCELIISQILNFADCIKTRILEAKKGMIPLEQGILLYEGLLNLITFSASSEFEKTPVKRFSRKLDRAVTYAETSLMGQSELGSYVANVYLPLRRPNPDFRWVEEGEFSRRVVLRILRGLKNLDESVKEARPNPIIDNYATGLNSNMCDALISIIETGMGNAVIFNAILEPTIPIPDGISTEFILKPSDRPYLKKAIDELKEEKDEEEERTFFGYVSLLKRPEEIEKGMIRLRSIDAENNITRNIMIELNPSAYHEAVNAHGKKMYIRIKGILERVGRRWFLRNPNNLEVLEDDSELPWKTLDKF